MSLTTLYTLASILLSAVGLATLLCLYFTRRKPNTCLNCQYPRENLPHAAPCPECGVVHSSAAVQRRQSRRRRTLIIALLCAPVYPLSIPAYTTVRIVWWHLAYPRWKIETETNVGPWTIQVFEAGRPNDRYRSRIRIERRGSTALDLPDVWPLTREFAFAHKAPLPENMLRVDVTGDNVPELLVIDDTSQERVCTLYVLSESDVHPVLTQFADPRTRRPTYWEPNNPINITDLDADGTFEITFNDATLDWTYDRSVGVLQPPRIIFTWNGTTFAVSPRHIFARPQITDPGQIADMLLSEYAPPWDWPPLPIRQYLVNLIYSGQQPLADATIDELARRSNADYSAFKSRLNQLLNSSPYWPTLKAQFDQLRAQTLTPPTSPTSPTPQTTAD